MDNTQDTVLSIIIQYYIPPRIQCYDNTLLMLSHCNQDTRAKILGLLKTPPESLLYNSALPLTLAFQSYHRLIRLLDPLLITGSLPVLHPSLSIFKEHKSKIDRSIHMLSQAIESTHTQNNFMKIQTSLNNMAVVHLYIKTLCTSTHLNATGISIETAEKHIFDSARARVERHTKNRYHFRNKLPCWGPVRSFLRTEDIYHDQCRQAVLMQYIIHCLQRIRRAFLRLHRLDRILTLDKSGAYTRISTQVLLVQTPWSVSYL